MSLKLEWFFVFKFGMSMDSVNYDVSVLAECSKKIAKNQFNRCRHTNNTHKLLCC